MFIVLPLACTKLPLQYLYFTSFKSIFVIGKSLDFGYIMVITGQNFNKVKMLIGQLKINTVCLFNGLVDTSGIRLVDSYIHHFLLILLSAISLCFKAWSWSLPIVVFHTISSTDKLKFKVIDVRHLLLLISLAHFHPQMKLKLVDSHH